MRVLLTGIRGFVGRRLASRLAARGDEISGFDRELDVADAPAVAAFVARHRPEAVVHLAALSSVAASLRDAATAFRVNYLGAQSLLRAVHEAAPGARVLLVGSGDCYGPATPGARGFDETAPLRPRSPYARAKAAADLLGAWWCGQGLDVVRVHPFPHTGPGQADTFAASSFARQLAEIEAARRPPRLEVGSLDSVRDYLDVDDVVEAYVELLDPARPATRYNVASGRGTTLREVLGMLIEHAEVEPEVVVDPARVRPADVSIGRAERLRKATGWAPRRVLRDTLGRLLDDWRRRVSVAP